MSVTKKKRCTQCWRWKPMIAFVGARGGIVRMCSACRTKYAGWTRKSFEEKLAMKRRAFAEAGELRVIFTPRSGNKKTGPIPVSMTGRGSCPDACAFKGSGCYAEYHHLRKHWDSVPKTGLSWEAFCERVAALAEGQLWRHNEAGDLPGKGDRIDPAAMRALVRANRGRRGFTYTHKPVGDALNRKAIREANRDGFVVNLSADTLEEADLLVDLGIAPVTVVVGEDALVRMKTPGGRRVVICPAQTTRGMTCEACELCAYAGRKSIVAFRAHGQSSALVSELVRERRDRS